MLEILKALANEKRLMIIYCLTLGDLCQVHLSKITKIGQVDISRSAKLLSEYNIIESRNYANRVIYSLNNNFRCEYSQIINLIQDEYSYLVKNVDIDLIINECKTYKKGDK